MTDEPTPEQRAEGERLISLGSAYNIAALIAERDLLGAHLVTVEGAVEEALRERDWWRAENEAMRPIVEAVANEYERGERDRFAGDNREFRMTMTYRHGRAAAAIVQRKET